jgi:hypothetical protein
MHTRRARERSTAARLVVAGAIALVVLFAGARLDSVGTPTDREATRDVVAARDPGVRRAVAPSTRETGAIGFAVLVAAIAFALFGAIRIRARRSHHWLSAFLELCFRLRAPPRLPIRL